MLCLTDPDYDEGGRGAVQRGDDGRAGHLCGRDGRQPNDQVPRLRHSGGTNRCLQPTQADQEDVQRWVLGGRRKAHKQHTWAIIVDNMSTIIGFLLHTNLWKRYFLY